MPDTLSDMSTHTVSQTENAHTVTVLERQTCPYKLSLRQKMHILSDTDMPTHSVTQTEDEHTVRDTDMLTLSVIQTENTLCKRQKHHTHINPHTCNIKNTVQVTL